MRGQCGAGNAPRTTATNTTHSGQQCHLARRCGGFIAEAEQNKALTEPASYRPIALLLPYAKVLAPVVAGRLRTTVLAAAASVEQYAYLRQANC